MNILRWPTEHFNSKFFSGNDQPKENTETVSMLSGRQVSWKVNTKSLMKYKVKLRLTKTELAYFWTWYNDSLCQNANAFTCAGLGNAVYRFVSVPSPEDTDQTGRTLSMEIEEVY